MADTLTPAMIDAGLEAIDYEELAAFPRTALKSIYLAMNAARTIDDAPDARPDVERVARAIHRHSFHPDESQETVDDCWERHDLKEHHRKMARAAIAALSSHPSQDIEAMREALAFYGKSENYRSDLAREAPVARDGGAKARAALSPKEPGR
jgi:hypothetical protein